MLLDAGLIETSSSYNKISKIFAFYPFKDFITFQYLIVSKEKGTK